MLSSIIKNGIRSFFSYFGFSSKRMYIFSGTLFTSVIVFYFIFFYVFVCIHPYKHIFDIHMYALYNDFMLENEEKQSTVSCVESARVLLFIEYLLIFWKL